MTLDDHVKAIDAAVGDARTGLPEPVFALLSRLTPMVNVDLLIKNDRRETLLTWRDDELYLGWHVPGGVVRFKERLAQRVDAVARTELGTTVTITPEPLAVNEIVTPHRDARGHFLSFLFACRLDGAPDPALRLDGGAPKRGQWAWHASFPPDMIPSHGIYRTFIDPPS
jgi:ADP-ribose pyrophosphatase YjhB (NUDIX family)